MSSKPGFGFFRNELVKVLNEVFKKFYRKIQFTVFTSQKSKQRKQTKVNELTG
jgi:hypothetical protein